MAKHEAAWEEGNRSPWAAGTPPAPKDGGLRCSFFKSVGTAVQDVATAQAVLEQDSDAGEVAVTELIEEFVEEGGGAEAAAQVDYGASFSYDHGW